VGAVLVARPFLLDRHVRSSAEEGFMTVRLTLVPRLAACRIVLTTWSLWTKGTLRPGVVPSSLQHLREPLTRRWSHRHRLQRFLRARGCVPEPNGGCPSICVVGTDCTADLLSWLVSACRSQAGQGRACPRHGTSLCPAAGALRRPLSEVVQLAERWPLEPDVGGSSPPLGAW
jgi:hypothetical protein